MWHVFGSLTEAIHALLIVVWIVALPLLFVKRWPRLRRTYAIYAVVFIVLSQGSQLLLGECFITTLARAFWEHPGAGAPPPADAGEWFTVRFAKAVFSLSPSHRAITLVSEALMLVTAVGVLYTLHHHRAGRASASPPHGPATPGSGRP